MRKSSTLISRFHLRFFTQHQANQQPAARFTFAESGRVPTESIDETRIDLTGLDESGSGRGVATVPSQSPRDTSGSTNETSSSTSATLISVQIEPIAGTSSATEANVPQVLVTDDVEGNVLTLVLLKRKKNEFFFLIFRFFISGALEVSEFADDNASTTETDENKVSEEIEDIEDEEGIDGVSSEGEKTSGGTETVEVKFTKKKKKL